MEDRIDENLSLDLFKLSRKRSGGALEKEANALGDGRVMGLHLQGGARRCILLLLCESDDELWSACSAWETWGTGEEVEIK